jgi:hypothetical protein
VAKYFAKVSLVLKNGVEREFNVNFTEELTLKEKSEFAKMISGYGDNSAQLDVLRIPSGDNVLTIIYPEQIAFAQVTFCEDRTL